MLLVRSIGTTFLFSLKEKRRRTERTPIVHHPYRRSNENIKDCQRDNTRLVVTDFSFLRRGAAAGGGVVGFANRGGNQSGRRSRSRRRRRRRGGGGADDVLPRSYLRGRRGRLLQIGTRECRRNDAIRLPPPESRRDDGPRRPSRSSHGRQLRRSHVDASTIDVAHHVQDRFVRHMQEGRADTGGAGRTRRHRRSQRWLGIVGGGGSSNSSDERRRGAGDDDCDIIGGGW